MSITENDMVKPRAKNYGLGHLFLDAMKKKPADGIFQIDAATGESETNGSVLSRSIDLARCFREFGLNPGDILALGGRNHLDIHIPHYAALFIGLPVVGVDPYFKYDEIKHLFELTKPKIAFCQQEMYEMYEKAGEELGLDIKVVSFDGNRSTFKQFMDSYHVNGDLEDFQISEFDTDTTPAWLVSTSGTTGRPKVASLAHPTLVSQVLMHLKPQKDPTGTYHGLNLSTMQWLTGFFNSIGMPLMNLVKLQTSKLDDIRHYVEIVNKYKPVTVMMTPSSLLLMMEHDDCDLTCFRTILLTGAKLYKKHEELLKARLNPECQLLVAYGQTETLGATLLPNPSGPQGNVGRPMPTAIRLIKLVNPETGLEVTEPHVIGEFWTKGPSFSGYYNNPEATAAVFTEDGWFKTGDLLYRDENDNYFFVDRIKMLIKYRGYHINPLDVEEVILQLPNVAEVCVVGVDSSVDDQLATACVVKKGQLSEDDVHGIVAAKLSPSQRLRGGVVFVDSIPRTSSGKIARSKVKKLVIDALAKRDT